MTKSFFQFEHVIDVNTPKQSPLSLTQLWNGLVQKVLTPEQFIPGLDDSTIRQLQANHYQRKLHFSNMEVEDTVVLSPMQSISINSLPSADLVFESKIAVDQESRLLVRFVYRRQLTSQDDLQVVDYLKQVYQQMDEEAIERIRQLYD